MVIQMVVQSMESTTSADDGLQWPTVAYGGLQWPHPPGRTSWQKLIDHLLLFIQCTILQHSSCHSLIPQQFIINRNMVFYMLCPTFFVC